MPGRQVIIITILIIMIIIIIIIIIIMIIIMIITFFMTMILITIIIFFHEHNVYGYQTLTVIFQRTCTDRQPCTATNQHQVLGKKNFHQYHSKVMALVMYGLSYQQIFSKELLFH